MRLISLLFFSAVSIYSVTAQNCVADYGTPVGGPACCGQPWYADDTHICPDSAPKCLDYVFDQHWGHCEPINCAANYGTPLNGPVCCGQTGTGVVTSTSIVCPGAYPICNDYVFQKQWGFCQRALCCPPGYIEIGTTCIQNACTVGETTIGFQENGLPVCMTIPPHCSGENCWLSGGLPGCVTSQGCVANSGTQYNVPDVAIHPQVSGLCLL